MVNSMRSKKRILALATVIAVVSVVLSSCSKTVFDAQKYITQTENLTFSKYQDKTFNGSYTDGQNSKICCPVISRSSRTVF